MRRTRHAIMAAFAQLLEERPMNKITVKDIVDRCDVNRNTFYYHFQDIPSLLREMMETQVDGIIREHCALGRPMDCIEPALEYGLAHRQAVLHVYRAVPRELFEQYLDRLAQRMVAEYFDNALKDTPILSEDEAVEFSRLSRAVNQMLLRLKQAFDAQQQFVGNAAHELRTPLALMQARLDLYMSTDHGDSCPETAETIAMMREQTERLSRMVRTLLDMSELKAVPRNDRIQLAPMIEEVLADLSPLAEKSGVTLSQSGEDLWITGSDVLVYRAIFNLVENAVKYNRPGGSVSAAVSRRGEEAMIEIKDTGCGIPKDFRESVFQPFFRVDKSRSREKGGVGLGLSLVWEIAHLHGGDVRVRESGESGTAIELTLPASEEERGMP